MLRLTGAITLLVTLLISIAHAQRDFDRDRDRNRNRDLVLLGQQTVGFGVDRDVINIGQSEDWFRDRSFRSLRFVAERNDVHMMSIRLVYLNGFTEDFRIDRLIRQGTELPLDLTGERSYLKQIEMTYRSRPDFRGQAVIRVFGEPVRRVGPPGPPPVANRGGDWVLLGQQTVGFGVDRDVINIGQSEEWFRDRSFRSLRFVAERNDIYMMSIRLVYLNGYAEDFRIDRLIRQGSDLPIDLGGERSYLKQIEMIYRSRPDFRGQAVIRVFGEPVRRVGPPGPPPAVNRGGDWVELGCQQVNLFGNDRDSIRIGRREGRFKAIRLSAREADVEVLELKVIYTDGQPDDIAVQHFLRAGERTRALDLRGWERAIDRVDLVYRTVINPVDIVAQQRVRMATVCVEGLQ